MTVTRPTHAFKPGDRIVVIGLTPWGGAFVEGPAIVEELIAGLQDGYWVRFINERIPCIRIVHAEYQADAARMVAIVNDLWLAATQPERLSKPFPNDLPGDAPAAE